MDETGRSGGEPPWSRGNGSGHGTGSPAGADQPRPDGYGYREPAGTGAGLRTVEPPWTGGQPAWPGGQPRWEPDGEPEPGSPHPVPQRQGGTARQPYPAGSQWEPGTSQWEPGTQWEPGARPEPVSPGVPYQSAAEPPPSADPPARWEPLSPWHSPSVPAVPPRAAHPGLEPLGHVPASAPPYPYEGDLDPGPAPSGWRDAWREPEPSPAAPALPPLPTRPAARAVDAPLADVTALDDCALSGRTALGGGTRPARAAVPMAPFRLPASTGHALVNGHGQGSGHGQVNGQASGNGRARVNGGAPVPARLPGDRTAGDPSVAWTTGELPAVREPVRDPEFGPAEAEAIAAANRAAHIAHATRVAQAAESAARAVAAAQDRAAVEAAYAQAVAVGEVPQAPVPRSATPPVPSPAGDFGGWTSVLPTESLAGTPWPAAPAQDRHRAPSPDDEREDDEEPPPPAPAAPPLAQPRWGGPTAALPQRVPAPPDVPGVTDDDAEDEQVDLAASLAGLAPPELARIATGLRDNEAEEQAGRPDGFDFAAVLEAVRDVTGVRDAHMQPNASGVHTLRLDLFDGADGARVSREVARLLKQRMGLAAEPRRVPVPAAAAPAAAPVPSAAPVGVRPAPPAPAPRIGHVGGPALLAEGDQRYPLAVPRVRSPLDGRVHPAPQELPPPAPPLRRTVPDGALSRVLLDHVQVRTLGLDATVEVRLAHGGRSFLGTASGPSVDGYILRLAAVAAAAAIDQILSTVITGDAPGRCFVEHAAVVPLGSCEVAVVVVLLTCGGWVQQLAGSAVVNGDPRQAVVRATLAGVNRRLDGLLG